jgi:tetratricopeptide (TPR) repeat protein
MIDEPAPWGPALRLAHQHAVDPVPDIAAAKRAQAGLEPTDARWVALQHGIAIAEMVDAAASDHPDWAPVIDAFAAGAKAQGLYDYDHADELLFDWASIALHSGDMPTGQEALLQLIREHPRSRFIPNAYAVFGDFKFDQGQFLDARRLYEKLMQWEEPSVRAYALYRSAWCDLRDESPEADATRALERFVQARRAAVRIEGSWGRRLADASLRDSALAYARVGRPDKARAFFTRLARDTDAPVDEPLRILAEAYEEQGDPNAAAEICRDLGCD